MRTIIAGSRNIHNYQFVAGLLDNLDFNPSVVLSGTASGIDSIGAQWAKNNGIPVEEYPADWVNKGRSAGYLRNIEMALNAQALVAIWDGKSKGTEHMINIAQEKGLYIKVFQVGRVRAKSKEIRK